MLHSFYMERVLFIGRFQPLHRGHLGALAHIAAQHAGAPIVVAIGSANRSHTANNPFTAAERAEMLLRAAAADPALAGVTLLPIPLADVECSATWVAHIMATVPRFCAVYSGSPLVRGLFGQYSPAAPAHPLPICGPYSGTRVRRALAAKDSAFLEEALHKSTLEYLEEIDAHARMRMTADDTDFPQLRSA